MRSRSRGFSLALVLLVASVVLTVGFAMAALSSFSLNLATQTLNQARADALSRAVTAQVCYELDQRVWTQNPWQLGGYPDMAYGADAVRQRFQALPVFPDTTQHVLNGTMQAWVEFDGSGYFSVDNLASGESRQSYADQGTSRASVPPYSLSLVVNTGIGTDRDHLLDVRHFESVICRAWPYAAYSVKSPVCITGGSLVRGDIYAGNSTVLVGEIGGTPVGLQGDVCMQGTEKQSKIGLEVGSLMSGTVRYEVLPPVGPPPPGTSFPTTSTRTPRPVGIGHLKLPPPTPQMADALNPFNANPFDGVSKIDAVKFPVKDAVSVTDLKNLIEGWWLTRKEFNEQSDALLSKIAIWRGNERLSSLQDYRGRVHFRFPGEAVEGVAGFGAYGKNGAVNALVLSHDIALSNGVYLITQSLTNHFGVESTPLTTEVVDDLWTGDGSGPATISLQDTVLIVYGDLDMRGLTGDNSTLYVTGNLFLNGGKLESGEKGMLVMASNVVIEAEGDFRGVIASKGNITLKPLKNSARLKIRGGLLAEGYEGADAIADSTGALRIKSGAPITVSNTTLTYDRAYTKSLNRLGTTRVLIHREVL